MLKTSDDSISGFQFQYDIDMIFRKYCNIDIDIDIFKMISLYILYKHEKRHVNIQQGSLFYIDTKVCQ